eukprot:s226_g10.t1
MTDPNQTLNPMREHHNLKKLMLRTDRSYRFLQHIHLRCKYWQSEHAKHVAAFLSPLTLDPDASFSWQIGTATKKGIRLRVHLWCWIWTVLGPGSRGELHLAQLKFYHTESAEHAFDMLPV